MYKKIILRSLLVLLLGSCLFAQDITSGLKLIRNEKYNAAKKYFSSLVDPKLKAEAYFYLGQIYLITEDIDSAKASYLNGINTDPELALNYAGLFRINVLANETSEIEKNYSKAIELGEKDNFLLYITLSEAYSNPKIKNYDKALELLTSVLNNKKKNADVYINIGKVYLAKGNGTEAFKNFEEALKIDAKNSEALTLKAKIYILINKSTEAISMLNEVIANDPTYSPAYNEMAELYAGLKDYSKASEYFTKYIDASEVTLEKQKRYASILYVNKEYLKAIDILTSIISSDKNSASSVRILAYSYFKLDEIEKSKTYFKQLFEMKSVEYLPTDYENYADLLTKTGNDSLAILYLSKIVETDSTRKDVLSKMSVLYFKNKNWEGVISTLEKKNTLTAQEYFDLSKAYIFKGDGTISGVIQNLNSKLKLNDEQIGKIRQSLLYYQKDLKDANLDEQKITAALDRTDQMVETVILPNQKSDWGQIKKEWIEKIHSDIHLEYSHADSNLSLLLNKAPNLAIAYVWKARVNANFDPETESGLAKPYYEKFIELAKNDSDKYKKEFIESYSYLGYYFYLQKDNQQSKFYWQEVLKIDPENIQAKLVFKLLK